MQRIAVVSFIVAGVGFSTQVLAAPVAIPHTFSPNTPALSAEVNANFNTLADAINTIDAGLAPDAKRILYAWDITSLEQALDDAAARVGIDPNAYSVIYMLPGSYTTASTLVVPGGTQIYGFNVATIYSSASPSISTDGAGWVSLNDLYVNGGGYAIECITGTLMLRDVKISAYSNTGNGVGVFADGCTVSVEDKSSIFGTGLSGIGISASNFSSVTVRDSLIGGSGSVDQGTGISSSDSYTEVFNSEVRANGETGAYAIGTGAEPLLVRGSVLSANTTTGNAIAVYADGDATIILTQLDGNLALFGVRTCYGNYGGSPIGAVACP